jgi:integrase
MAAPKQEIPSGTILEIFEVFMDWVQANRAQGTYDYYRIRIDYFIKAVGNMPVRDLKSYHVQNWLDKQSWSDSYKAGIVASLKYAFSWAVGQGYLQSSPLQGLKKPPVGRRDQLITPQEFETLLSHARN